LGQALRAAGNGLKSFIVPADNDIMVAHQALQQARKAMVSGKYDIVILDEICVALHYNPVKLRRSLSIVTR
jgi:cob(I)alamin adenosyltransferase